ncbi:Nas6p [Saccharomyces cerevisiae Vin13]|nr:Nas6p [Saccharomyces cerevisiae Vin13]
MSFSRYKSCYTPNLPCCYRRTRMAESLYTGQFLSKHMKLPVFLLSKMENVNLDDYPDDSGWTPFHIACSVGNLEVVKSLYDRPLKPDLNKITNQGVTCLHLAVGKKWFEVSQFLIENGASVGIKDKFNQIPLHRAASVGSLKLIELLCGLGKSPVNWQDKQGWTPLFHALAEGHGDAAVLLVEKYGAEYDLVDNKGAKAEDVALNEQVKKFFLNNV